uniref:Receptor-like serine/threonine-protein kinase n=1 Tax=Cajanus cajan TaxID=3821 RepID=A0A151SWX3_CAJCA|nr:Cysteine-rich receptor-like protein kinase 10 [Cajanus cajan]
MSFSNDAKLFFVLFILCCYVLDVGIAIDSITSSQSIKDPDTLSSEDGNFTLGFFTPQNSKKRYVGIWWKSESTVIWVANRNQPLNDSSGVVTISEDGNLVVLNGQNQVVWSTNASNLGINSTSKLLDSGNLVLVESTTGNNIWESFQHPSNALLPNMRLTTNKVTGEKLKLTSWKSPSDPSTGSFSASVDRLGMPELFVWNETRPFWRSGPWDGRLFTGLSFMRTNYLTGTYVGDDGQGNVEFILITNLEESGMIVNILNSQGNVEQSMWNEGKKEWVVTWKSHESDCDIYGACGPFAICNSQSSPTCSCLQGFEPRNKEEWNRQKWTSGCVRSTNKDRNMILIISITVTIGTTLIVTCAYIMWRRLNSKHHVRGIFKGILQFNRGRAPVECTNDDVFGDLSQVKLQELLIFSFEKIVTATNNFHPSNRIGQGGFGPVYKGKLQDGQEIAVKRLSRTSGQGVGEFMNEVVVISKLQHRNLVRLLGCCIEGEEKMLIYEYMPNKSLDAYVFDLTKNIVLDWRKRFSIIEGVARGMLYLHRDSRLKIIHRDLKASNILLDEELNPKISDFGMARIFGGNEDQANTRRVVGTYGYMSPEYAMQGLFSEKSDVFSFGVLLLEIVSGRRNSSFYDSENFLTLLGFVWMRWMENNILSIIDPRIYDPSLHKDILRCIHIGLLCVQEFVAERPTMATVISMLQSEIMNLPPPTKPAFTLRHNMLRSMSFAIVSISSIQGR